MPTTAIPVNRPLRKHLDRARTIVFRHAAGALAAAGDDIDAAAGILIESLADDPEFAREVDAMDCINCDLIRQPGSARRRIP